MPQPEPVEHMHRELKVVDAAAFSVGLIGPVGAIALLGTGAAGIIGRGVTLSFIFALVGVALVAYAFVRLSQHISHTGSVYALVGVTLGPRFGFLAGWALVGAYACIACGSAIEIGFFGGQFLDNVGLVSTTEWIWIALVGVGGVVALAFNEIKVVTRSLLVSEVVGAVLVTGLSLVILGTLLFSHGPSGQSFSLDFVKLPDGAGIGTVASAAVYGFLAFAGFEGAAALGEETSNPKREIPRAIRIAVIVVGVFYVLTAATQSLGYGTGTKGVKAFTGGSPFNDLGTAYIGSAYADLLLLMATISLLAIVLGLVSGAARILYALTRDATGSGRGLAQLSRHGQPARALILVLGFIVAGIVAERLAGSSVLNATFYAQILGTIALLFAYLLATIGAVRYLFFSGARRAPAWQAILPALGGAFVVYTIYKNVFNVPAPYSHFGWIVLAWLALGTALVACAPGLAGRVRAGLAASGPPVEPEPDVRLGLQGT
jgi:amino acid transporter